MNAEILYYFWNKYDDTSLAVVPPKHNPWLNNNKSE